MAKLKTFEEYVSEMDRSEEIEKEIVDKGVAKDLPEDDADAVQSPEQDANEDHHHGEGVQVDKLKKDLNDKTPPEVDADGKKYVKADKRAKDDSTKLKKDLEDSQVVKGDIIAKEVTEAKEGSQEEENEETPGEEAAERVVAAKKSKVTEHKRPVSEMLKEAFGGMKEEAAAWEHDEHDEHTIETYMTEHASLVGGFAANTLKEMKDEYALEAYEAACNMMKEAFAKKVDEAKESNMTPSEREQAEAKPV